MLLHVLANKMGTDRFIRRIDRKIGETDKSEVKLNSSYNRPSSINM